jgi:hypothetical protein
MGESTWADRFVLDAALQGLCDALKIKESRGGMGGLSAAEVLKSLKSSDAGQLRSIVRNRLDSAGWSDLSDYTAVLRNLDGHASEIYAAIQSFSDKAP